MTARSAFLALLTCFVLLAIGSNDPATRRDGGCHENRDHDFGLIGGSYDGDRLRQERAAGIETRVFELSWRRYYPREGEKDEAYIRLKKTQLSHLREAGFKIVLSLGYHDTPTWVHRNYPDSYYVNQFGQRWTGDTFAVGDDVILDDSGGVPGVPTSNGDANLVFNDRLRGLVGSYVREVFADFGTGFYGVRLGGGRYGEVTYPPPTFGGYSNLYWAFDANARASAAEAGIAGWRPGHPSPGGQAQRFLDWYLGSLAEYQNWQVGLLRGAGYAGRVMLLYPGLGVRPGDVGEAVENDLAGTTPAEMGGEIQAGHDFAGQVGSIDDYGVLVTTTALDAPASGDAGDDPTTWSPVKYLAHLAKRNPVRPGLYGENTGAGSPENMARAACQMRRHGLVGMAWYDEEQLFSGRFATLDDYRDAIESPEGCRP